MLVTVGLVGLAQAKPNKPRFTILPSDNAWVLDSTTALQWQLTPTGNVGIHQVSSTSCDNLGGGSRLPEVTELISLVDYSKFSPALPEGNPFQGVQSIYWSANGTAGASSPSWWVVDVGTGSVNTAADSKIPSVWCVR